MVMTSVHAKQVGSVIAVKGNVFTIHQGVTYKLKWVTIFKISWRS
jgi:hypothetical protein